MELLPTARHSHPRLGTGKVCFVTYQSLSCHETITNPVEKYIFEIISLLIILFGGAVSYGVLKNKVEQVDDEVKHMESNGTTYAREHISQLKQQVNYHETRLVNTENSHQKVLEVVHQIRMDLGIISSQLNKVLQSEHGKQHRNY